MSAIVEEIVALKAAGFTGEEIVALVQAGALEAQAPSRAESPAREAKAPKAENRFYAQVIRARVPCAYGVASCGFFAPNGVGSKQHTTCPKGRAALKRGK